MVGCELIGDYRMDRQAALTPAQGLYTGHPGARRRDLLCEGRGYARAHQRPSFARIVGSPCLLSLREREPGRSSVSPPRHCRFVSCERQCGLDGPRAVTVL